MSPLAIVLPRVIGPSVVTCLVLCLPSLALGSMSLVLVAASFCICSWSVVWVLAANCDFCWNILGRPCGVTWGCRNFPSIKDGAVPLFLLSFIYLMSPSPVPSPSTGSTLRWYNSAHASLLGLRPSLQSAANRESACQWVMKFTHFYVHFSFFLSSLSSLF